MFLFVRVQYVFVFWRTITYEHERIQRVRVRAQLYYNIIQKFEPLFFRFNFIKFYRIRKLFVETIHECSWSSESKRTNFIKSNIQFIWVHINLFNVQVLFEWKKKQQPNEFQNNMVSLWYLLAWCIDSFIHDWII